VDHIDYVPGSGRQLLSKNASLELCDDAACKPTKVTVTVKLEPAEDSNSKCEVDVDSIATRNQFCGQCKRRSLSFSFCVIFDHATCTLSWCPSTGCINIKKTISADLDGTFRLLHEYSRCNISC